MMATEGGGGSRGGCTVVMERRSRGVAWVAAVENKVRVLGARVREDEQ